MDQNKIYKNKHPSDFTTGSIIQVVDNQNTCLTDMVYMVLEQDVFLSGGKQMYAVRIKNPGRGWKWTADKNELKLDFKLLQGLLRDEEKPDYT